MSNTSDGKLYCSAKEGFVRIVFLFCRVAIMEVIRLFISLSFTNYASYINLKNIGIPERLIARVSKFYFGDDNAENLITFISNIEHEKILTRSGGT